MVFGGLALGYFGWFRDSSLVAVRDVEVHGVSGADSERIVAELTDAARGMSTLHVDTDGLRDAVREFPAVAAVSVDTSIPHGITIQVIEHQPTLIVRAGDRQMPVAADGSLLPGHGWATSAWRSFVWTDCRFPAASAVIRSPRPWRSAPHPRRFCR